MGISMTYEIVVYPIDFIDLTGFHGIGTLVNMRTVSERLHTICVVWYIYTRRYSMVPWNGGMDRIQELSRSVRQIARNGSLRGVR